MLANDGAEPEHVQPAACRETCSCSAMQRTTKFFRLILLRLQSSKALNPLTKLEDRKDFRTVLRALSARISERQISNGKYCTFRAQWHNGSTHINSIPWHTVLRVAYGRINKTNGTKQDCVGS